LLATEESNSIVQNEIEDLLNIVFCFIWPRKRAIPSHRFGIEIPDQNWKKMVNTTLILNQRTFKG